MNWLKLRLLLAAYLLLLDAGFLTKVTVLLIGIVIPPEHFVLGVCQLMLNEKISRFILLIVAILIVGRQRRRV
jgi:hypothetical protein